ncbi:unnamed protein product [Thlaspi arvense]|uniref:25S rRNA (uridine-N(3))-methyltransferase BMT5-like domain-containing protein n=1 Tax=Thlaspi arvense TaxID=13288 RepID=A0AAU9RVD6_THLAR|nr:unnamed protein product [Thlaspi arvense]
MYGLAGCRGQQPALSHGGIRKDCDSSSFILSIVSVETLMAKQEQTEVWVKHYCSSHNILLVGEGDFSFCLSLAQSFGSASNIVASSLDSYGSLLSLSLCFRFLTENFMNIYLVELVYQTSSFFTRLLVLSDGKVSAVYFIPVDVLIKKYKQAKSNWEKLEFLGASLLHGVDATKMRLHNDLRMQKFDRIIFNFPHAGFHGKEDMKHVIKMHSNLVNGFFNNASCMLRVNGEVHVNHKTKPPFSHWNIEEIAQQNSLVLIECVDFHIEDYPGYNNKRGDADGDSQWLQANCYAYGVPQPIVHVRDECYRIFSEYFNHATETFGRIDYNVSYSVHEALKLGFDKYMAEGRNSNGYLWILEELHHLTILRLAWLRNMLGGDRLY